MVLRALSPNTEANVSHYRARVDSFYSRVVGLCRKVSVLNKSKAGGPDLINSRLLIATSHIIPERLTSFFNRCFSERFPDVWKTAHSIILKGFSRYM